MILAVERVTTQKSPKQREWTADAVHKRLKLVVGARGFEPPTSRSRTERSTRLSHAPTSKWIIGKAVHSVKLDKNARPDSGTHNSNFHGIKP